MNFTELEKGERFVYEAVTGMAGGFKTKLFELICKADLGNRSKLQLGFPEEVAATNRYLHEAGYWESILNKLENI